MSEQAQDEAAVATNEGVAKVETTPESSEQTESEQQSEPTSESSDQQKGADQVADPWDGFQFQAPEGHDPVTLGAYANALKEEGVKPDAAQRALDKLVPVMQQQQVKMLDEVQKQWIDESKSDPEIGGERFDENLGVAKQVLEQFADDKAKTLFKAVSDGGQGLGNHPDLLRMLVKIGKAMAPDSGLIRGSPATESGSKARRLFPNSNMND